MSKPALKIVRIPTLPEGLPLIFDDVTLAVALRTKLKNLWHAILVPGDMYKTFSIRTGKKKLRSIHAPSLYMKKLANRMLKTVLNPLQEGLGSHVTAYRQGRGIPEAVKRHIPECPICDKEDSWLHQSHACPRDGSSIHLDLKDFFHSTKRSWIRRYFKDLGYEHTVANGLASLCTCPIAKGSTLIGVPQGSPVSGAICNLVADKRLDKAVLSYVKDLNTNPRYHGEYRWVYSRYSDDLCFTCGHSLSKAEIKDFLRDITRLINAAGYRINPKKTRWTHKGWRKHLLGANMNQHINPDPRMYKRVRGILHNCVLGDLGAQRKIAEEQHSIPDLPSWLLGQINWIGQLNPAKGAKLRVLWDQLQAKMNGDAV